MFKTSRDVVIVLLIAVVCSASSLLDSDDPVEDTTTQRPVACKLSDGRIMDDGANFTRLETGDCIRYLCHNGSVLPFPNGYSCFMNDRCHPLGEVQKSGCIERTCKLYEGVFQFVLTSEGCLGRDLRTCIDVGSTSRQGCYLYRCDKQQTTPTTVSYYLEQLEYGCELNGRCVAENYTYTTGCRTMQCQKRFQNVGFYTLKDGCEINGQCVDVGSTITDNCRTFNCTVKTLNNLNVLNIDPIKIQCKDTDGLCHDSGTYFPIEVNRQRANCTCSVQGFNIEYSCPGIGV